MCTHTHPTVLDYSVWYQYLFSRHLMGLPEYSLPVASLAGILLWQVVVYYGDVIPYIYTPALYIMPHTMILYIHLPYLVSLSQQVCANWDPVNRTDRGQLSHIIFELQHSLLLTLVERECSFVAESGELGGRKISHSYQLGRILFGARYPL